MSLEPIDIRTLHDGLNLKDDPVDPTLSEGTTVECVGFDLTIGGKLQTAKGNSTDLGPLAGLLPSGVIQCSQVVSMLGVEYVLATTGSGLYSNTVLIDATFTGRFKALTFGGNIYLTNGTYSRRFDGTTCTRWGIVPPVAGPVITAGANVVKTIDDFSALANWIANVSGCTVDYPKIGSDLVTNGTFTGSAAGWTLDAVDWTYNANAVDKDADGIGTLHQTLAHTIGKTYILTFTISNWTVGTMTPTLGGVAGTAVGADGVYVQFITTTTAGDLIFTPTNTSRFTIDTVSVYEANVKTTRAMKIIMAAAGTGTTYRVMAKNAGALSDGSVSPNEDLLEFWVYVSDLSKLSELRLIADVGDGTFVNDFYSYSWNFPGVDSQQITPSTGGSAEVTPEQSIELPVSIPMQQLVATQTMGSWDPIQGTTYTSSYSMEPSTTTSKITISRSNIEELFPELKTFISQSLSLYKSANITEVKSNVWVKLQVPKSYLIRTGTGAGTWSDDVNWKFEIISSGAVNIYIDQLQIAGGGKLYGDYWFMYGWARVDSDGNVLHYSGPARAADGTLHIQGPINFKRQPVAYSTRVASTDSQVNACVVYMIGGNLTNLYVLSVIENNLTTSGSFSAGEDDCYRRMISLRNDPAPAGLDMVFHKGSIWMIGFDNYPNIIRKSDISAEGDLLLEAWPGRNAYVPTGAGNKLTSIDILNRQIAVRGIDGEWVLDINDPGDFSSVIQDEVVGKGCLSVDGVMRTGNSVIYPAAGAFVESNGSSRNLVLPETSPVITSTGVADAVALFNNYEGYFSFTDQDGQTRTAKLDVMRGKPRVAYQNNLKYEWLFLHNKTGIVYGIINGEVVRVNYGFNDRGAQLECRLTSKAFQVSGIKSPWRRVVFEHLTNGQWLHIEAYVDGKFIKHEPFRSTVRTEYRFDFGPVSGNKFQFTIWGQYSQLAEIYLPIRIY